MEAKLIDGRMVKIKRKDFFKKRAGAAEQRSRKD